MNKNLIFALYATPFALFGDFEPTYYPNHIANICESKQAQNTAINKWGGAKSICFRFYAPYRFYNSH